MIENYKTAKKDLSGSITQNRFKFQNFWTICKLLELYEEGHNDFVVVFEGISDTDIIINNNDVHLYQLKTIKQNLFNVRKLISTKEGRESILSTFAKHDFKDEAETFNIVTNTVLKEKSGRKKVCLFDLDEEYKNKIIEHIKQKHAFNPNLKKYFYIQSDLCINDSYDLTLGKIVKFLEKQNKTDSTRSTLFLDYLKRIADEKSTYEFAEDDYEILIKKKGITKTNFEDILKDYTLSSPVEIDSVKKAIDNLSFNMYEKRNLKIALVSIMRDRYTLRIRKIIKKIGDFILEKEKEFISNSDKEILQSLEKYSLISDEFNVDEKKCLLLIAIVEFSKGGE